MLTTELNKTITAVLNHYNENHQKSVRGIKTASFRKWVNSLPSTQQKIAIMYIDGVLMTSHSNKVANRKPHTGAKQMKTELTEMSEQQLIKFIDSAYLDHLQIYA